MNNPAYYLEYEDGLGPYWKCFDGDDGQCMSTQRTKQDAMSWCRGWNSVLLNEIGQPYLSCRQWKKWFPGCPNSKHTHKAYRENHMTLIPDGLGNCIEYLAPTIRTFDDLLQSNEVPCQKGNNPMYIEDGCYSIPCNTTVKKCAPQAAAQSVIQVITDSKADPTMDQRKFLATRVREIRYIKFDEIAQQFHLNEPCGPKTVIELKERLKKGLYTVALPKNWDEDEDEIYWRDAFSWRTPETQFDKDGYNAALKELATFIEDILDQIAILDPKDGLGLLEDLKKWKPSKAKK